jgi:hypothetical protein
MIQIYDTTHYDHSNLYTKYLYSCNLDLDSMIEASLSLRRTALCSLFFFAKKYCLMLAHVPFSTTDALTGNLHFRYKNIKATILK